MVRPLLQKLRYSKKDVENICFSIASHVDGKADFKHPKTLVSKILSDADKIDRFSVYRVMLFLRPNIKDYELFIADVQSYLKFIREYRKETPTLTATGKKAFRKQFDLQVAFLEQLLSDKTLTVLPEL